MPSAWTRSTWARKSGKRDVDDESLHAERGGLGELALEVGVVHVLVVAVPGRVERVERGGGHWHRRVFGARADPVGRGADGVRPVGRRGVEADLGLVGGERGLGLVEEADADVHERVLLVEAVAPVDEARRLGAGDREARAAVGAGEDEDRRLGRDLGAHLPAPFGRKRRDVRPARPDPAHAGLRRDEGDLEAGRRRCGGARGGERRRSRNDERRCAAQGRRGALRRE